MKKEDIQLKLKVLASRDSRFVINAFAISLVILALMFAFLPYANNGGAKIADIKRVDKNIVTIHPDDLGKMVQSASGKPVMLVFYASWCGYCKKVMPVLVDMVRTHELEQVDAIFVSMDEQPRLLSKYLVNKGYDDAFTPYRLDRDIFHGSFAEFITSSGSHYRGGIPYVGFFNHDGKLISDASGVIGKQDVLSVAKLLQQN